MAITPENSSGAMKKYLQHSVSATKTAARPQVTAGISTDTLTRCSLSRSSCACKAWMYDFNRSGLTRQTEQLVERVRIQPGRHIWHDRHAKARGPQSTSDPEDRFVSRTRVS